ncbi:hypothetical protein KQI63_16095 [bacterium]|nr:hypothetical protein [bacterium]
MGKSGKSGLHGRGLDLFALLVILIIAAGSIAFALANLEPLSTTQLPVYHIWWVQLLALLLLIAVVLLAVRSRERVELEHQQELERLLAERTAELDLAMQQLEQAKEAELEARRLQTLNQLAATIAHEFNNPLGIIQGFSDLTQIDRSTDQMLRERMERVNLQVQRMHSLVRKLLRLRTLREADYAAALKILDIDDDGAELGRDTDADDLNADLPTE